MATAFIVVGYILTFYDDMTGALRSSQLIIAATDDTIAFDHFPLLEASSGHVLPEKHIDGSVDVLEHVITSEDHCIKAFKDHTDLCS